MDDFIDFCQHRRSIRKFRNMSVSQQDLIDIVTAGSFAPSVSDLQPWEFIIVTDPQVRDDIAGTCEGHEWMYYAPAFIVVLADHKRVEAYHGSNAALQARDSCSAAVMNMLLAAMARDLGACWVSQFDEQVLSEVLGVDDDSKEVVAIVVVGHPDEIDLVPKHVSSLDQCVYFNEFGNTVTDEATRLRDFGEAARDNMSSYSRSVQKKVKIQKERSKPIAEKFREKLRDWMDSSKNKKN